MTNNRELRVCVIGAGKRFLSGISYYTLHLINELAQSHRISAILMRQLLPTALYPGRERVGADLTQLEYDRKVRVFDGVDWYWLPSIFRSLAFLMRERPDVVIFQWWSGTVLHSYLFLALAAGLLKAQVIIEFHEVIDTGEAKLPLARAYVRFLAPFVVGQAQGFVVHSEYDRKLLMQHYELGNKPVTLIPHGPYNPYQLTEEPERKQNTSACNFLFFGVIRPFKGLEDLIAAFNAIPENEIAKYHLTIVGETWEGWTLPADLIEQSRYRDRITFVNRYVADAEVAQFFAEADAVVLPYHRSSMSGPLHIAMSCGLPIVVTKVGGLIEAVKSYEGAILISPGDVSALQNALLEVAQLSGKRYTAPHSWEQTSVRYKVLFNILGLPSSSVRPKVKELSTVSHSQNVQGR